MDDSSILTPPRAGAGRPGAEPDISLVALATILLGRWRLMGLFTLAAFVVAGLVVALQPRVYQARVTLVPPADGTTLPFLGGAALPLPLAGLSSRLGTGGNNQQLVEAILKSMSLQDSMVVRLQGPGALDDQHDEVRRTLKKRTTIRQSDTDRSIAVEVTHRDPARARQIAALFPEVINEIATRVAVQSAFAKRRALERQIAVARTQLEESENRMLAFEQERGAPAVQEQAKQAMVAAAELQKAVVEQELAVSRLRRTTTPNHPQLQAALAELQARRAQLARFRSGRGETGVLTAGELPEVKLSSSRLLREYVKDEQVYLSLTASLAEAQMDANQNLAVVTVLDEPRTPVRPSGPKIPLYLLGGAFLGLLAGIAAAFTAAYLERARGTPDGDSLIGAWDTFKADVSRLVPARPANGRTPSGSRRE